MIIVVSQDRALDMGISSADASFLLSIIGIVNTVGRIVLGYISDKPWLNRLWLYNIALTICGIGNATVKSIDVTLKITV